MCLSVCLSIYLSSCLSTVLLSMCLSVYLSIYLYALCTESQRFPEVELPRPSHASRGLLFWLFEQSFKLSLMVKGIEAVVVELAFMVLK